ncbi:hypothetical protein RYA05_06015 [Pseudomonas syringae pv. actinidiae]|nr:hypothetical protein [Pseudomonas syringae pv. actinidiae]
MRRPKNTDRIVLDHYAGTYYINVFNTGSRKHVMFNAQQAAAIFRNAGNGKFYVVRSPVIGHDDPYERPEREGILGRWLPLAKTFEFAFGEVGQNIYKANPPEKRIEFQPSYRDVRSIMDVLECRALYLEDLKTIRIISHQSGPRH